MTKVTVPEDYRLAELKNKYIVFTDPEITYNTFYMTKILDRTIINNTEEEWEIQYYRSALLIFLIQDYLIFLKIILLLLKALCINIQSTTTVIFSVQ